MDWDTTDWVLSLGLMVLVAFFGIAIWSSCKDEDAWMSQCQRDHKQYECEDMWARAHPAPAVVPVYIPSGSSL